MNIDMRVYDKYLDIVVNTWESKHDLGFHNVSEVKKLRNHLSECVEFMDDYLAGHEVDQEGQSV